MNMSIIWDPHPRLHFSFLRKLRVGVVSRGTNDRVWIHEAWPQGSRARLRTRARLCRVGWHDWAAALQTFSTTMWSDEHLSRWTGLLVKLAQCPHRVGCRRENWVLLYMYKKKYMCSVRSFAWRSGLELAFAEKTTASQESRSLIPMTS